MKMEKTIRIGIPNKDDVRYNPVRFYGSGDSRKYIEVDGFDCKEALEQMMWEHGEKGILECMEDIKKGYRARETTLDKMERW